MGGGCTVPPGTHGRVHEGVPQGRGPAVVLRGREHAAAAAVVLVVVMRVGLRARVGPADGGVGRVHGRHLLRLLQVHEGRLGQVLGVQPVHGAVHVDHGCRSLVRARGPGLCRLSGERFESLRGRARSAGSSRTALRDVWVGLVGPVLWVA